MDCYFTEGTCFRAQVYFYCLVALYEASRCEVLRCSYNDGQERVSRKTMLHARAGLLFCLLNLLLFSTSCCHQRRGCFSPQSNNGKERI